MHKKTIYIRSKPSSKPKRKRSNAVKTRQKLLKMFSFTSNISNKCRP